MKRSASRECIIAYHEAGHAVASWRLGDGITRVTIEPSCDAEREERYDGSFTAGRGDRSALGGWGFRYAVMVLAGPAAQRAYDPRSQVPDTAGYDHRELDNLAVIMCRSPEAQRAFVAWAKAEARALIRQDWHLVEALARQLMVDRTLDGPTATAILAETDAALWVRVREAVAGLTRRD